MNPMAATSSTMCFTSPRFAVAKLRNAMTRSVAPVPMITTATIVAMMIVRWKSGCTAPAQYS